MKILDARVRNEPFEVIRVRSIPVYFDPTSRNEMKQVTDEIQYPVGDLNDVP